MSSGSNLALNPDAQKTARQLAFRETEINEEENIDQLEQRQGQRMGASPAPARPGD
jgi:hypothetical protein